MAGRDPLEVFVTNESAKEKGLLSDAELERIRENAFANHYGYYAPDDVKRLLSHIEALGAERDKAMRALESLTPGGSEYVNDVERCVETIKATRATQHQVILRQAAELNWLRATAPGGEK
jgi:hypothetical protein